MHPRSMADEVNALEAAAADDQEHACYAVVQ